MSDASVYLPHVQESIGALGYIKPEYEMTLAMLLATNEGVNPVEIARKYRKNGEQLSADEKRALGFRSNTFFSREAFESLTAKGCSKVKDAHATTLLRAMFGFFRARTIAEAKKLTFINLKSCALTRTVQHVIV